MRKIISILVALGLLLSLSAIATPVGAQPCATVAATSNCAGATATYTFNFLSPVSLTPGNDRLSVDFPTGTTFGTFVAGDILVNGNPVAIATIVKTGSHLDFAVPGLALIVAGTPITLVVAKVVNGPAGTNNICLDYQLVCCDPVQFCCVPFTVVPAVSTLGFHVDFSPTYIGLAEDFIPPFKACGQAGYGHPEPGVGDVTDFNLILRADVLGCAPPCTNATMWFVLTACPAGETVTFNFNGTTFTLTAADLGLVKGLPNVIMPPPPPDVVWPCWIHFSSPGEYEICFYLECPAVICGPGSAIVAEECFPFKAYQWKEAYKIPLYRKWNLISLPLVELADPPIADMLNAYMYKSDVISIWHFDQCTDKWAVWPTPGTGQEALTNLVDGKSYWVRIVYNSTHPAGMPADGLWTWGTPKPTPPASPSSYAVCTGWNMVGFTDSTAPPLGLGMADFNYLWNWFSPFGVPEYGTVCGWDPVFQQFWSFLPTFGWFPWMYLGEGYWISFDHDGTIYPP